MIYKNFDEYFATIHTTIRLKKAGEVTKRIAKIKRDTEKQIERLKKAEVESLDDLTNAVTEESNDEFAERVNLLVENDVITKKDALAVLKKYGITPIPTATKSKPSSISRGCESTSDPCSRPTVYALRC